MHVGCKNVSFVCFWLILAAHLDAQFLNQKLIFSLAFVQTCAKASLVDSFKILQDIACPHQDQCIFWLQATMVIG